MKKVLLLHISKVGGHSKAAENIKEAILFKNKNVVVETLNSFGYFYPKSEKVIDFIYTNVIKYFPYLWGKIYDRKFVVKKLNPLWSKTNEFSFYKVKKLFDSFAPDCIVATQAFPAGLVSSFKEKSKLDIPLIAVVTDYYPHRFWIHPQINRYVVACKQAKDILVSENVPEEKVEVLGIPISVKFLLSYDKDSIAKNFGFIKNLPAILIMGGGLGLGPIKKIATVLDSLNEDFQIIVVCGTNKKLFSWFDKNKKFFKKPLFFFGYVDFVNKLMDFADIIITKGGGITVSEALSKGLAIIITKPIPGQEERNVNFLLSREAVIREDKILNIGYQVSRLLNDRVYLEYLKQKAKSNSIADSSIKIADLVLSFL